MSEGSLNMSKIFFKRAIVAAAGAASLSLGLGSGVANADPIIDTTCSYGQVMNALSATNPELAAKFNSEPLASGMLANFLSSPPAERVKLSNQFQKTDWGVKYFGQMSAIAGVCNNY